LQTLDKAVKGLPGYKLSIFLTGTRKGLQSGGSIMKEFAALVKTETLCAFVINCYLQPSLILGGKSGAYLIEPFTGLHHNCT